MSNLFTDPVQWSGAAVRTWPRFWFMAIMLALLNGLVIYQAAEFGWRASGLVILVLVYHLMFLYAMRRMYFMLQDRRINPPSADT